MWTYFISYVLMILITDHSGYQDSFVPIAKLLRKHPFMGKLLRCSLCMTFWMSLVFVLCGYPYWLMLMPWLASSVSGLISLLLDVVASLINKISVHL